MKEGMPQVDNKNLDKPRGAEGTVRRTQMAAVEFTTDVADAVAAGWKTFREQLSQSNSVLDTNVVRGSVEAAASFLEGVAKATRRSLERFDATAASPATRAPEIDYEKLSSMVAQKLQPVVKA
ncbi:MAG: hypothetical protein ABI591_18960 [Kofleriaceae bacterium]